MADSKKDGQLPEKTIGDHIHSLAKGVVSLVPGGGIAAELYQMIVTPQVEQRRDAWFRSLHERLSELENKCDDFRIEKLQNNDEFISLLLSATIIAMRNHKHQKLDAMRNIVVNAAEKPNEIENDLQLMFLHIIDGMTTWHLQILLLLNNPAPHLEKIVSEKSPEFMKDSSNTISIFGCAFPELEGKDVVIRTIINDLDSMGLTNCDCNAISYTPYGILSHGHVTEFGITFIKFISEQDAFDSSE